MASRLIRNQLPSDGLRVRAPCPPLVFGMSGKFCGFATLFAVGVPSWSMAGKWLVDSVLAKLNSVSSRLLALPAYA